MPYEQELFIDAEVETLFSAKNILNIPGWPSWIYGIEISKTRDRIIIHAGGDVVILEMTPDGIVEDYHEISAHEEIIFSMSLSHDEATLATGSADKTVKIWRMESHELVTSLALNQDPIRAVQFSQNGDLLASGGERKYSVPGLAGEKKTRVYVWDWKNQEIKFVLYGHSSYIRQLQFFDDDQYLASLENGLINIWDMQNGNLLRSLDINCCQFQVIENGKKVVTCGDEGIEVWSLEEENCIHRFWSEKNGVFRIAISSDENLIAAPIEDKIGIFELRSGIIKSIINVRQGQHLKFSSDGHWLAVNDLDSTNNSDGYSFRLYSLPQELYDTTSREQYPIVRMPPTVALAKKEPFSPELLALPQQPPIPAIMDLGERISSAIYVQNQQISHPQDSRSLKLEIGLFFVAMIATFLPFPTPILVLLVLGILIFWKPVNLYQKSKIKSKPEYQAIDILSNEIKQIDKEYQDLFKNHERALSQWSLEYQKTIAELNDSTFERRWRLEQVRKAVSQLQPAPFDGDAKSSSVRRGYAEIHSDFPKMLKSFFGDKIIDLKIIRKKIPDIIYYDPESCLAIDIEIDEPYTPRQYPDAFPAQELKVTHCIEQESYENRSDVLTQADWFVVHFAESQIIQHPAECCRFIAKLIDELTGSKNVETKFAHVPPHLDPVRRWTEIEAKQMANARFRLNY